jgi:serine/threonine-protein kinase
VPIAPGKSLLHYRLVEPIGEGAMGQVWKAFDTTLDRDVALKILPVAFVADATRLARFEREAKVLASLQHPGIAAVHGFHAADGIRFLAMELVPGEDLAQRLARGALPLDEAIEIAVQIATALEDAHEHGIVHRDLKPANIKHTPEGAVKILDFGLAKALATESTESSFAGQPTVTSGGTMAGSILGTAAYMSPEQARGRTVDRRTDIWGFGCVLFEMLTGKRAFDGETVTDCLAAVVSRDPEWNTLPRGTPVAVRELLQRCLEKDPRRRLRHIGDALFALQKTDAPGLAATAERATATPLWKRVLPWGVAALALAWAASQLASRRPAVNAPPVHLAIRLPAGVQLDTESNYTEVQVVAISPPGTHVAFTAASGFERHLYVRSLVDGSTTRMQGTLDATAPFFSPDGRWIGYFARGHVWKIAIDGGEPTSLCAAIATRGGAWGPDGTIVFSPGTSSPLMRVPSSGGAPVELTKLEEAAQERTHRWPAFLPGGDEVAFTVGTRDKASDYEAAAIDVVSLSTGKRRRLFQGASMARATASGYLLLGRAGRIESLSMDDVQHGKGEPQVVLRGVEGAVSSGIVYFDLANNGTLVFVERNPHGTEFELAWVSRDGRVAKLDLPARPYQVPRLSPDGKRVAVRIGSSGGGAGDIWVHELASGTFSRLTFDNNADSPTWGPGSDEITYIVVDARGDRIAAKPADGNGPERTLLQFQNSVSRALTSWSPDRKTAVVVEDRQATSADLLTYRIGATELEPLVDSPSFEMTGSISPNGKWLAYSINDGGRIEVYVQPFQNATGRWQVSENGGHGPTWSRDGSELFYVLGNKMMAVSVGEGGSFTHGASRQLFEIPFQGVAEFRTNYDVAADGRFIVVRGTAREIYSQHLNVILNWTPAQPQSVRN